MLIGNKIDLDERQVQYEEGLEFATKMGFLFNEVSAKTGYMVKESFEDAAIAILNRIKKK